MKYKRLLSVRGICETLFNCFRLMFISIAACTALLLFSYALGFAGTVFPFYMLIWRYFWQLCAIMLIASGFYTAERCSKSA